MLNSITGMAPYLIIIAVLCIVIIIMTLDNIKEKFISALGLDNRYVKREDCNVHRQDIQVYTDASRKQILDKLDTQTEMLAEMKVSHELFMDHIKTKLNE